MSRTVFFDFDGTLVDSAPGILSGFQLVLQAEQIAPVVEVTTHLIGPPLQQTLAKITGETDPARLGQLVEAFKREYDSAGYQATQMYPGLEAMLAALSYAGYQLVIVTNKRRVPTEKILEWFGLSQYFDAIYTPDTWQPAVTSKNDTLARAVAELGVDPANAVMIGDSGDDAAAAEVVGMRFVAVSFGYGNAATQDAHPVAARVDHLDALAPAIQSVFAG